MPSTTYSFVFFCPTVKLRIRKHTNALAYGNEVNLNSANGPNKFLAILLKSCKNVLARLFQSLYQGFHTTFKLPTQLKECKLFPCHKRDSRSKAKNYRPTALTQHISKIIKLIVRRLITILKENDQLTDSQNCFQPGRSCLTQILQHYDWVLNSCSTIQTLV